MARFDVVPAYRETSEPHAEPTMNGIRPASDLHGKESEEREVVPLEDVSHDSRDDSPRTASGVRHSCVITSGGMIGLAIAAMGCTSGRNVSELKGLEGWEDTMRCDTVRGNYIWRNRASCPTAP
jgi:hypothetical protein